MRGRERKGKVILFGGGSLRPSQRRAERAARRSQKRADERQAFLREADAIMSDFFAFEAAARGPEDRP